MRRYLLIALLTAVLVVGCSSQKSLHFSEFPIEKGTTWVYSYEAYEPSASDPRQIIRATYQLTQTVVETDTTASYFVAHVRDDYQLVNSDKGWKGWYVDGIPKEKWYVVSGQKVFGTLQFDIQNINEDKMVLEYVFPLEKNSRWCQLQNPPCESVGWRVVTSQGSYKTPEGNFDDCYDIRDIYNGGGTFQKFCVGVGIASTKYDHVGTSFGFEQTLIRYSVGVP